MLVFMKVKLKFAFKLPIAKMFGSIRVIPRANEVEPFDDDNSS